MKGFSIYPAMQIYATMIKDFFDLINGIMFDINLVQYGIYLNICNPIVGPQLVRLIFRWLY